MTGIPQHSPLLIHEPPLMVLPRLAVATSLGEAIILQQVHYWCQRSKHEHEGRRWIYNTIASWQAQFPFWGANTIIRGLAKLEERGLILTGFWAQNPMDRTKWYTVDYAKLGELIPPEWAIAYAQIGQMEEPILGNSSLPETNLTETTRRGARAPRSHPRGGESEEEPPVDTLDRPAPKRPLTEEYVQALVAEFAPEFGGGEQGIAAVLESIHLCRSHKVFKGYTDQCAGVRNWVKGDRDKYQRAHPPARGGTNRGYQPAQSFAPKPPSAGEPRRNFRAPPGWQPPATSDGGGATV